MDLPAIGFRCALVLTILWGGLAAGQLALAQSRAQPARVPAGTWQAVAVLPAAEAHQAAAADERFVYAITNTVIVKYDRISGERIATSRGRASHLNSGFFWQGKLYCAHSNYPQLPARSEIMVLDTETMLLTTFKEFGESHGSLTWAVRHDDHWWCNFAHYGDANAKTVLVKLDDAWRERGKWTYPPQVLAELGQYSISGGVWHAGQWLVTGHDEQALYRLRFAEIGEFNSGQVENGAVLQFIDRRPAPFTGQGIATDPTTGGLIGIHRAKRQLIIATLAP